MVNKITLIKICNPKARLTAGPFSDFMPAPPWLPLWGSCPVRTLG